MMLSSGKLSPALIDPTHLQKELISIQKQLLPTIRLPEDPIENVWHYFKYLILNYIPLVDKIIVLVKIPLVDNHSALNLYFKMVFDCLILENGNCEMSVSNVTSPEAIYLAEGNWAIATVEPDQMEITCTAQKHVISLNPPLTLVNLQSACSAFSSKLKLPTIFQKFFSRFCKCN